MTWARLDDTFHHHPKLMRVNLAATGLFALGLSYAADNLTDGHLPEKWVRGQMVGEDESLTDQLVRAGLWERAEGGFQIHDFDTYNLTREQVLSRRDYERDKKRTQRGTEDGTPPGSQGTGKGTGNNDDGSKGAVVAREWDEWLDHYHAVTGRMTVRGSTAARDQFRARRREFSLDELKLATIGSHSDEFCRSNGHDVPETILRASKVQRYIERGKAHQPEVAEVVY